MTQITDPFILMLDASNFLPMGFTKLGLSHLTVIKYVQFLA